MIPGSANPLLLASAAAAGPVQIERSLRFNSSDSGFLSRTFSTVGDRTKWTVSFWLKVCNGAALAVLFGARSGSEFGQLTLSSSGDLVFEIGNGTPGNQQNITAPGKLRDPSAWYHILLSYDTSGTIVADMVKIYINGTGVTPVITGNSNLAQNYQTRVNNNVAHVWSNNIGFSGYLDGYLADVHFIDGQALTPSSFTEVSATTGRIEAKLYAGSFGTNGFWLPFNNNSTAAALGTDYSGNSNTWTVNNLSVTAGAGNDSLVDTPTSYGTDTGVGGSVRGNYCTWNPLATGNLTAVNGNLGVKPASSDWQQIKGTISVSTGKWYWESTVNPSSTYINQYHGISNYLESPNTNLGTVTGFCYGHSGDKYYAGSYQSGVAASYTFGDVIGMALDLDSATQTIKFYKNGTLQFTQTITGTGPWHPASNCYYVQTPTVFDTNFGQRAFAYTAPSGFKALCDTNLGAPLVAKPNTLMDVSLWTGNGTQTIVSGLQYSPDFVWIKSRSTTAYHMLFDVVRGAQARLHSNTTDQEQTGNNDLTSFNSDGYTLDNNSSPANTDVNGSGITYVGWSWDAGTSTDPSNTAGSITSQVRANVSAGFSIVSWTGTSSSGTIGHGLNVAPALIIVKCRSTGGTGWPVYHQSLGGVDKVITLQSTAAVQTISNYWNTTAPSSTTFGVASGYDNNVNGATMIAYAFSPVVGYSSFGSYTGNGSADGPFVYTGFRPKFVLIKNTSNAYDWLIFDAVRSSYNVVTARLFPNTSASESPIDALDFTSNGFKIRYGTSLQELNQTGASYIYYAVAENPFQYARAR